MAESELLLVRLATLVGRAGKPSIIIDKEMGVFIGNEVSDSLELTGVDLFGFNTGAFDVKVVEGRRHSAGIPWRLRDDLELVCSNKSLVPTCKFLHKVATTLGIADVSIPDHEISPKLHPVVAWTECSQCIFMHSYWLSTCVIHFS